MLKINSINNIKNQGTILLKLFTARKKVFLKRKIENEKEEKILE